MSHDPLCPTPLCDFGQPDAECQDPYECWHHCQCDLIARVREDERAAALRDAVEAINATADKFSVKPGAPIMREFAAAIEALT